MRAMQVERGKTRPQTLMTGHTGYITHARKILKLPAATSRRVKPAAQSSRWKQRKNKRAADEAAESDLIFA